MCRAGCCNWKQNKVKRIHYCMVYWAYYPRWRVVAKQIKSYFFLLFFFFSLRNPTKISLILSVLERLVLFLSCISVSVSLSVSACLSVSICVCLSVAHCPCLPACLSACLCLSVCLSVFLCLCLSVFLCLSVCLSVSVSVSLSVSPSVCVSVFLSFWLPICMPAFLTASLSVSVTRAFVEGQKNLSSLLTVAHCDKNLPSLSSSSSSSSFLSHPVSFLFTIFHSRSLYPPKGLIPKEMTNCSTTLCVLHPFLLSFSLCLCLSVCLSLIFSPLFCV